MKSSRSHKTQYLDQNIALRGAPEYERIVAQNPDASPQYHVVVAAVDAKVAVVIVEEDSICSSSGSHWPNLKDLVAEMSEVYERGQDVESHVVQAAFAQPGRLQILDLRDLHLVRVKIESPKPSVSYR